MPLTEIEFELPALQYQQMNYPGLKQGEPLTVILDGGVLLPDPAADSWFTVQKEPLPGCFKQIGPAFYAFTGQIKEADILKDGGEESATLVVACGEISLRVTCAPLANGQLPYGTWETRYLTGCARVQGIVEDDYAVPLGQPLDVTLWRFRRLVLTPGDAVFGEWHETDQLRPAAYSYDRVFITARLHRLLG